MKKTLTGHYSGNFPLNEAMHLAGIERGQKVDMTIDGNTVTIKPAAPTMQERIDYAKRYIYPYRKDWIFQHRTFRDFYLTTAYGYMNGRILVGHSICAPEVDNHPEIGNAIALIRAIGGEVPAILLGE